MAWVPLQEWLPGYEPYLDTISSIVLSTHAGTEIELSEATVH